MVETFRLRWPLRLCANVPAWLLFLFAGWILLMTADLLLAANTTPRKLPPRVAVSPFDSPPRPEYERAEYTPYFHRNFTRSTVWRQIKELAILLAAGLGLAFAWMLIPGRWMSSTHLRLNEIGLERVNPWPLPAKRIAFFHDVVRFGAIKLRPTGWAGLAYLGGNILVTFRSRDGSETTAMLGAFHRQEELLQKLAQRTAVPLEPLKRAAGVFDRFVFASDEPPVRGAA